MASRPTIRGALDPSQDAAASLALGALAWILAEPDRADRLLALTGLSPDGLRHQAGDPALLASIIGFLEAHEPDLIACAETLDVPPARLVAAGRVLGA